jgi:arsenate reductase-like glutaredoxin family protein
MTIATANAGLSNAARNTMPLSVVIVDDEQLARDELAYLLKNLGDVNVVSRKARTAWRRLT